MAAITSIAAGVGLAATAATTGMSFANANKQKKMQRAAEEDARQAMEEARKKLEVNYYDQLAVKKEPYQLEREALLSAGAQAIQAGVEGGSRGVAPTAGRVVMAQNEEQGNIRSQMGKEMSDLAQMSAEEDSRLRDAGVKLDLAEAQGAQLAARDAQEARAASMEQGMAGITSLAQQGMQLAPLYTQDLGAQKAAISKMNMSNEEFQKFGDVTGSGGGASKSMGQLGSGGNTNLDLGAVGQMNDLQFMQFKRELSPAQRQMLFQHPQYLQNYNPFQPY